MPRLQARTYWTKEREQALLKLGEAADTGYEHKDWDHASAVCPKERKLLKDKTNSQLSKTYIRVLKSTNGICMRSKCNNAVADGGRYCVTHRKIHSENARKFPKYTPYSIQDIEEHKKEVITILKGYPKERLITFILDNFHKTNIYDRVVLLNPEYQKLLRRR